MYRNCVVMLLALALCACGLAETAATGATAAGSEAEAAKQAQQTEQQIQQKVEDAKRVDAEKRRTAEDNNATN
jgi:hypothetical protein